MGGGGLGTGGVGGWADLVTLGVFSYRDASVAL